MLGCFRNYSLTTARLEDYFPTTNTRTNRDLSSTIYKQAQALTYTVANVACAFKKCRIVPFNPRPVLS